MNDNDTITDTITDISEIATTLSSLYDGAILRGATAVYLEALEDAADLAEQELDGGCVMADLRAMVDEALALSDYAPDTETLAIIAGALDDELEDCEGEAAEAPLSARVY